MIFVLLRGMSDTAVTLSSEWVRFPKAYQISKSLSDFPKHIRFPKAYQISKILSDFSEVGYHGKKTIGVWWEISNTYQKVLAITLQISALSLAVKIRHNLLNHYIKQFWLSFSLSTIFLICLQMFIILVIYDLLTWPKTTCLPSSHWVLAVQRKNCDPLVLGPALAMDRTPARRGLFYKKIMVGEFCKTAMGDMGGIWYIGQ